MQIVPIEKGKMKSVENEKEEPPQVTFFVPQFDENVSCSTSVFICRKSMKMKKQSQTLLSLRCEEQSEED